jgi:hypothetical protein
MSEPWLLFGFFFPPGSIVVVVVVAVARRTRGKGTKKNLHKEIEDKTRAEPRHSRIVIHYKNPDNMIWLYSRTSLRRFEWRGARERRTKELFFGTGIPAPCCFFWGGEKSLEHRKGRDDDDLELGDSFCSKLFIDL